MQYIFLSLIFNKEHENDYFNELKKLPMSVQNFQSNLLDGFFENGLQDFCVLNTLPFPSFPKYKHFVVADEEFVLSGCKCKTLKYSNIPLLKERTKTIAVYKSLKALAKEEDVAIIVYSLYIPYLRACLKFKNERKNAHLHVIIPDLPYPYAPVSKSRWVNFRNKYIEKKSIPLAKRFDSFTFLTDGMAPIFADNNKRFCIVEGVYKHNEIFQRRTSSKKVFLYSGTLRVWSGILDFIIAFSSIHDKDIELWIFGAGEVEDQVKKAALKDHRIKYYGYIKHDELEEKMRSASFLINPRRNSGEYVKYSFPSKTIEYLSTGIPVIMFKLAGIPGEYDDFVNYFHEDIKESIRSILDTDYNLLLDKAKRGKEFVVKFKNPQAQAKKIINTIGGRND